MKEWNEATTGSKGKHITGQGDKLDVLGEVKDDRKSIADAMQAASFRQENVVQALHMASVGGLRRMYIPCWTNAQIWIIVSDAVKADADFIMVPTSKKGRLGGLDQQAAWNA